MKPANNYIQESILNDLQARYNKLTLTKKELAHELNISVSSINNYISRGYGIPDYVKIGSAKNGTVLFNLHSIAEYLSATIKVA